MKYIKNDIEMEKFRKRLRTWRIEKEWNEFNYSKPRWLGDNVGVSKEKFVKTRDREIYELQKKGDKLEGEIAKFIFNSFKDKDYILIHDLIIKDGYKKYQLDLVLVTQFGVFILEVKDWKGHYKVKDDVWLEEKENGDRYIKKDDENPTLQIRRHKRALSNFLSVFNVPIYELIYINCNTLYSDSIKIKNNKYDLLDEINYIINNNSNVLSPFSIKDFEKVMM